MMADMSGYTCPVCGFGDLLEPPYNASGRGSFEICPSCGFEFGYDDESEGISHEAHRASWLAGGAEWFDPDARPQGWDLATQLARIGIQPGDEELGDDELGGDES
jgi:hypothetical protein